MICLVAFIVLIVLPSLLATLLFRRGAVVELLRIEIVTREGLPARRWRTFLRCLIAWLPLLLLPLGLPSISLLGSGSLWLIWILVPVFLGGAAYALVNPERGLQDRLAGTWLVPR